MPDQDRLEILVQKYFENALDETEAGHLADLLEASDEKVRKRLRDMQWTHFLLWQTVHEARESYSLDISESLKETDDFEDDFFHNIVQLAASSPSIKKPSVKEEMLEPATSVSQSLVGLEKKRKTVLTPILVLLGAVCLFPFIVFFEFSSKITLPPEAAIRRPIAVLTDTASVQWEGDQPFQLGEPIHGGRLALKSGFLEILLYNGNRIILEGPADVSLLADNQLFCMSGKLSATVPSSGIGLVIQTPHATIEDLGTAFFLDVAAGKTDLQVVEGLVQILGEEAGPIHLGKTDGIEIASDRKKNRYTVDDSTKFVSPDKMKLESDSCAENRERRKQAAENVASLDPILSFDFQEVDGTIQNSRDSTGFALTSIRGGKYVPGRGESRGNLRLVDKEDRIAVNAKTPLESATFCARITIENHDSLTFHPILMSRQVASGGLHWHIAPNGALNFGFYSPKIRGAKTYLSPIVFTPDLVGKSIHVALVFDSSRQTVSHYFNGRIVASLSLDGVRPISLQNTLIGNWMPQKEFMGSLGGTIEDFKIYDRVLNSDEIHSLSVKHD